MPVLVFSLLMALLVAAVYYAQQDERDQNQAKLIADALWARQNIQFQVGGLINSLQALTNDSLIYPSARLAASLNQLSRSSGELVAVFRGPELTPIVNLENNFDEYDLEAVRNLISAPVNQRYESRLDGLVGPFLFQGRHYVANVSVAQRGLAVTAGLIDLDLMLEKNCLGGLHKTTRWNYSTPVVPFCRAWSKPVRALACTCTPLHWNLAGCNFNSGSTAFKKAPDCLTMALPAHWRFCSCCCC